MNDHSELLSKSLIIIYPLMFIFGFYIIINGHLSPGGGFQGGAVLASMYICKYLVLPIYDYRLEGFKRIEKLVLIIIMLLPVLFLTFQLNVWFPGNNQIYMIIMNLLIAIKVTCGISIIFFRFVFFESR